MEEILLRKPRMIRLINKYFYDNEIKKIALYGMGVEAKHFLQIAEDIDVEICYGIDRRPNEVLTPCYKPTDTLPDVDAILITNLRSEISEIKINLAEYAEARSISLQKDILEKRFEIHRQIYNALLQKALTRYRQMAQTEVNRKQPVLCV